MTSLSRSRESPQLLSLNSNAHTVGYHSLLVINGFRRFLMTLLRKLTLLQLITFINVHTGLALSCTLLVVLFCINNLFEMDSVLNISALNDQINQPAHCLLLEWNINSVSQYVRNLVCSSQRRSFIKKKKKHTPNFLMMTAKLPRGSAEHMARKCSIIVTTRLRGRWEFASWESACTRGASKISVGSQCARKKGNGSSSGTGVRFKRARYARVGGLRMCMCACLRPRARASTRGVVCVCVLVLVRAGGEERGRGCASRFFPQWWRA